ncbi:MAG: hypothetical protein NFCOHLIN_03075 [Gammaproteobacteria bacterium]|nr:hypothetical protein [Gammaproteobacteria bacterium]
MSRYPYIEKPLKGVASFSRVGEDSSQSQAAVLLMLGRQLRGDDAATVARARAASAHGKLDVIGLKSESEFPVPRLRPSPVRLLSAARQQNLRKMHGAGALTGESEKAYLDCATRLYKKPTVETAADLFEMCLRHPLPLVKIAAATAYFPVSAEPGRLIRILKAGVRSEDLLERDIAATALGRIDPASSALRFLTRARRARKKGAAKKHTVMLVHGTWAGDAGWWQPGGDFHTFIKRLRSDLYSAADRFEWSGGYSDFARSQAAGHLKAWVDDHAESGLDLMGHSHGANVIMLATSNGTRTGRLVLLSCPVHVDKYFPDFGNCASVCSVRVKLDLVILADRGGQKFTDPRIKENVLPIWFNHSATHDPAVWTKYNVAAKIGLRS